MGYCDGDGAFVKGRRESVSGATWQGTDSQIMGAGKRWVWEGYVEEVVDQGISSEDYEDCLFRGGK